PRPRRRPRRRPRFQLFLRSTGKLSSPAPYNLHQGHPGYTRFEKSFSHVYASLWRCIYVYLAALSGHSALKFTPRAFSRGTSRWYALRVENRLHGYIVVHQQLSRLQLGYNPVTRLHGCPSATWSWLNHEE